VKAAKRSRLGCQLSEVFALLPAGPLSPSSTGAPHWPNAVQTPEKTPYAYRPTIQNRTILKIASSDAACKSIAVFWLPEERARRTQKEDHPTHADHWCFGDICHLLSPLKYFLEPNPLKR